MLFYLLHFQTVWSADLAHFRFILLRNLFKVNILDVLFHLFMHLTAVSWALNISAKHTPGKTALRKIAKVRAIVPNNIQKRWLQMTESNIGVQRDMEYINIVTEYMWSLL